MAEDNSPLDERDDGEATQPPRFHAFSTLIRGVLEGWWRLIAVIFLVTVSAVGLASCAPRNRALDRIRADGMIRVAIDPSFPPFEFVSADGDIAGFDVDLARAIADRLGVEAHFVTTGYDALYDALAVNRADVIISALYPDPSRTAQVNFSQSYFNAGEVLIVSTKSIERIEDIESLAGKEIACVFGTEGHMLALEWEEDLHPPPILRAEETAAAATDLIVHRDVDAAVVDRVSALMARSRHADLEIVLPPVSDEPYVIAVGREHTELMIAIEEILQELEEDGTLEALTKRWMRP
jgi:polar amino acid transport system substrate-binding protein